MDKSGFTTESLIENEIGCGPFQVLIVICLFLFVKMTTFSSYCFMMYGNYNPGWRCLDNETRTQSTNDTVLNLNLNLNFLNASSSAQGEVIYHEELKCVDFEACQTVEFNPESSTIVTEWKLVCERAWISNLIMSIQMVGTLVGSFIAGPVADAFGRRKTLYGFTFLMSVMSFVSTFSSSWQMFAVIRFFTGALGNVMTSLNYIYPAEFLTKKWRGPLCGIPGWGIAGTIFGLIILLLKDWRRILITTSVITFVSVIPVVWVPESLRWLAVKGKREELKQVVEKMAKMNKRTLSEGDNIWKVCEKEPPASANACAYSKKYTYLDLFYPGYRLLTIYIGLAWLLMAIVMCAIGFGIKALSGNFYVNFTLAYALLIPVSVFTIFGPNLLGRTKCCCIAMCLSAVSLLIATMLELFTEGNTRAIGGLVIFLVSLSCADIAFCVSQAHVGEIYPTVVRATGISWAYLMAGAGAIVGPFLIPVDSESVYVWYLVTGSLALASCALLSRLPETRGRPLKDTFESDRGVTDIPGTSCQERTLA